MDTENLEAQLKSLETRVSTLEAQLHKESDQSQWTAEIVPSTATTPPKEKQAVKPGNWLGIIAIICFIVAAGFIVKLTMDSGWLTPARQIGLAHLLGLALIGAGYMLLPTDRSYASLLPAAGIIILYLATFAAYRLYSLILFQTAIALTVLISILCIWLYIKIKHDLYAIVTAVGAYIAPIVLGLETTAIFSLYYFVVCSLTFATISIWVHSRTLTMLAAYLAILASSIVGFGLDANILIAVILALHFLIFSLGTYFYTQTTKQYLTETEAWSFFPVLIIFYVMEYYFIDRSYPHLAPWISLLFAGFLLSLYLSAKKWFPTQSLNSQSVILAFVTLVAFHSIYLELLPVDVRPWLFVLILLGSLLIPQTTKSRAFFIPSLAIFAILAIEYLCMLSNLLTGFDLSWLIVSFAAFFSIWALLFLNNKKSLNREEFEYLLLGSAHLLGITGLYRLMTDYGSLAVSASWLFYAILVISFAFYRKDRVMARSALLVLSFAAGKALLYDASSTPTIVRIGCLLLTGVVLYGAGLIMRKIAEWK
ncbi:DUF2339 domain-containing protein [Legionella hackeliae]|uniref:DUF2339 domain-containing protein n=1 Tax=Legionella hackeliae TaxID=449 RepID=A0A0A8USB6_LEGHA|nr:DUF2339 domain-containing protein [Legionella hackeliae]KTD09934.1 hypothetical protein Lhac_2302 [Legionella hackeliae]CEK11765.1 membrane protein of unknown function [Legionella hackeliae]STX48536.1 Predicted membrane protein [Legionella hackeliae]